MIGKTVRQYVAERAARDPEFAEALAEARAESEPLFSAPRVCRGCGCTESDACLVQVGHHITGCWWVEDDLCCACATPERKVRGPRSDHRLAPAGTGADDAAQVGEGEDEQ